eukprot:scaffold1978_cov381-Prasinococcus_capsulatus_cf.AAC.13
MTPMRVRLLSSVHTGGGLVWVRGTGLCDALPCHRGVGEGERLMGTITVGTSWLRCSRTSHAAQEGKNGLLFSTSQELCDHLTYLLDGFSIRAATKGSSLAQLRAGVALESNHRWSDEWEQTVWPLVLKMTRSL